MNKDIKMEEEIVSLIKPLGTCMATDKIGVEGELVSFMYRDQPESESDSGWRFLSGTETQDYADNPDNWSVYALSIIANHDEAIISYMEFPFGTALERIKGSDLFR